MPLPSLTAGDRSAVVSNLMWKDTVLTGPRTVGTDVQ